ncbi:unnamed protein product, partial [marine sediment metagenome]
MPSLSRRRKLKSPEDEKQNDSWWSFHFATRLKLDGADYFCRQVLGAASMPDYLGLPLLAHRQLTWHLDAFFFELMSACDTLLQELNIVYAYDLGLKPREVRWEKIQPKLPKELVKYMEEEWEKARLEKIRKYRNMATHHYRVPTGSGQAGWGDKPLDYSTHNVYIYYLDDTGDLQQENISVCTEYLKNMVRYISGVWKEMAQKF